MVIGALALTVVVGSSAPADAKGPTRATLTGPEIDGPVEFFDRGTGLENSQSAASRVFILTGLWGEAPPALDSTPSELGEPYTIKWLAHVASRVSIEEQTIVLGERTIVQHIYLDAEDSPLIHTPDQVGLDGWGNEAIGWFEAPSGLETAIEDILAERGSNRDDSRSAWLLSAIAFATVVGLVGLGRQLSP